MADHCDTSSLRAPSDPADREPARGTGAGAVTLPSVDALEGPIHASPLPTAVTVAHVKAGSGTRGAESAHDTTAFSWHGSTAVTAPAPVGRASTHCTAAGNAPAAMSLSDAVHSTVPSAK